MYVYTGMEQVKYLSLNTLIRGVVGHAQTIILMICFCTVSVFPFLHELSPKIIPYVIKRESM
jgi:hypothetical protein